MAFAVLFCVSDAEQPLQVRFSLPAFPTNACSTISHLLQVCLCPELLVLFVADLLVLLVAELLFVLVLGLVVGEGLPVAFEPEPAEVAIVLFPSLLSVAEVELSAPVSVSPSPVLTVVSLSVREGALMSAELGSSLFLQAAKANTITIAMNSAENRFIVLSFQIKKCVQHEAAYAEKRTTPIAATQLSAIQQVHFKLRSFFFSIQLLNEDIKWKNKFVAQSYIKDIFVGFGVAA